MLSAWNRQEGKTPDSTALERRQPGISRIADRLKAAQTGAPLDMTSREHGQQG